MEDNFEKHLIKIIKALPQINYNKDLWIKIADELDFEERINQACKDLPILKYPNQLWNDIQRNYVRKLNIKKIIYLTSIAATILLLISTYNFFNHSNDYTISYSTEIQNYSEPINIIIEEHQNIFISLDKLCQYSKVHCATPEFLQIKIQLYEIETEIQKINQVINYYGESPGLLICLTKMENQKSELINELLNKLKS